MRRDHFASSAAYQFHAPTGGLGSGAVLWRVRIVADRLGVGDRRRIGARDRPPARHLQTRPAQHRPRPCPSFRQPRSHSIIAGMWDNLGRVAAEYPHLRRIRVFEPGGRVETHGFEHIDRAVAAGRRMIIFSGHIANWEIGMLAAVQYGADGRADLPRRQQSAGRPNDHAVSRHRRRTDPQRHRSRPARYCSAAARRASDDARRPEDE